MLAQELTLEDLPKWLSDWASQFSEKQLILLSGSMGMGKTTFTRELLQAMGCDEVSSPTYGLMHEYQVSSGRPVFHVDLYRLEDHEDLESAGFWDLFEQPEALILIEWADRLNLASYPLSWSKWLVSIEKGRNEASRKYQVQKL